MSIGATARRLTAVILKKRVHLAKKVAHKLKKGARKVFKHGKKLIRHARRHNKKHHKPCKHNKKACKACCKKPRCLLEKRAKQAAKKGAKRGGKKGGAGHDDKKQDFKLDDAEWVKLEKSNEAKLKDFQGQLNKLKARLAGLGENCAEAILIRKSIDNLDKHILALPSIKFDRKDGKAFKDFQGKSNAHWRKAEKEIKDAWRVIEKSEIKLKGPNANFKQLDAIKDNIKVKVPADIKGKFQNIPKLETAAAWKDAHKVVKNAKKAAVKKLAAKKHQAKKAAAKKGGNKRGKNVGATQEE